MTEKKNTSRHCVNCGSTDLDYGYIVTTSVWALGGIVSGAGTLYCSNADRVQAGFYCTACLNCGHMEFYLNPEQIKHQREQYRKNK